LDSTTKETLNKLFKVKAAEDAGAAAAEETSSQTLTQEEKAERDRQRQIAYGQSQLAANDLADKIDENRLLGGSNRIVKAMNTWFDKSETIPTKSAKFQELFWEVLGHASRGNSTRKVKPIRLVEELEACWEKIEIPIVTFDKLNALTGDEEEAFIVGADGKKTVFSNTVKRFNQKFFGIPFPSKEKPESVNARGVAIYPDDYPELLKKPDFLKLEETEIEITMRTEDQAKNIEAQQIHPQVKRIFFAMRHWVTQVPTDGAAANKADLLDRFWNYLGYAWTTGTGAALKESDLWKQVAFVWVDMKQGESLANAFGEQAAILKEEHLGLLDADNKLVRDQFNPSATTRPSDTLLEEDKSSLTKSFKTRKTAAPAAVGQGEGSAQAFAAQQAERRAEQEAKREADLLKKASESMDSQDTAAGQVGMLSQAERIKKAVKTLTQNIDENWEGESFRDMIFAVLGNSARGSVERQERETDLYYKLAFLWAGISGELDPSKLSTMKSFKVSGRELLTGDDDKLNKTGFNPTTKLRPATIGKYPMGYPDAIKHPDFFKVPAV
jgi:hypothetical protein